MSIRNYTIRLPSGTEKHLKTVRQPHLGMHAVYMSTPDFKKMSALIGYAKLMGRVGKNSRTWVIYTNTHVMIPWQTHFTLASCVRELVMRHIQSNAEYPLNA